MSVSNNIVPRIVLCAVVLTGDFAALLAMRTLPPSMLIALPSRTPAIFVHGHFPSGFIVWPVIMVETASMRLA